MTGSSVKLMDSYAACLQVVQLQSAHAHVEHEQSVQLLHAHVAWLHVGHEQSEHEHLAQLSEQLLQEHCPHSS